VLGWFLPFVGIFRGMLIFIYLGLIFYIIILANAVVSTRKRRIIERRKYDKWYVYLIAVGIWIFSGFVYKPLKDRWATVQFAKTTTESMSSALTVGDIFAWKQTKSISRNNIAIFQFYGESVLSAFRCVALPGDELAIELGLVYINDRFSDYQPEQLKFRYQVITKVKPNESELKRMGIKKVFQFSEEDYVYELTIKQAEEIERMKNVVYVNLMSMDEGESAEGKLFPFDPDLDWNWDFYGPLIIPRKGQTVEITYENATLYGTIISLYEQAGWVSLSEDGLLEINGEEIRFYTFKHDYYFMMGDNRHGAADSRLKGPVPDYLIRGTALYIFWSDEKNKIGRKLFSE
jgi:signal peptidase I